jgi:DNA repair exonuclease SbcCD ATPase subunit
VTAAILAGVAGLLFGVLLGRVWRDTDTDATITHLRLTVAHLDEARAVVRQQRDAYAAEAAKLRDQRDAALVGVSESKRQLEAARESLRLARDRNRKLAEERAGGVLRIMTGARCNCTDAECMQACCPVCKDRDLCARVDVPHAG